MYVNTTADKLHLTLCVCVAEGVGEVYSTGLYLVLSTGRPLMFRLLHGGLPGTHTYARCVQVESKRIEENQLQVLYRPCAWRGVFRFYLHSAMYNTITLSQV